MGASTYLGQKNSLDALDLEVQAIVSHVTRVIVCSSKDNHVSSPTLSKFLDE